MGLLKEKQSTRGKSNDDGNGGLDDTDEYGYSVEFITEKYASLAAQTGGQVLLVHVSKKREDDLGVSIVGNKNAKLNTAFVGLIAKKSPAEKCKKLKVADQLLEINGKTLYGRTLLQVTNLVKTHQQNEKLSLVVLRRKDAAAQMATEAESKAQMDKEASLVANIHDMLSAPTKPKAAPAAAARAAAPASSPAPAPAPTPAPAKATEEKSTEEKGAGTGEVITVMEVQKASVQAKEAEVPAAAQLPPRQKRPALPPGAIKAVVLQKEAGQDLGLTFYGKPQPDQPDKLDVFITKVLPASPAWLDGSLDNGDQILGINGNIFVNVSNVQHADALLSDALGDVEIIYRKKPHLLKNRALPSNYNALIERARNAAAPDAPSNEADSPSPSSAQTSTVATRAIPHLDYNPRKNDVKPNEDTWILLDRGLHQLHVGLSLVTAPNLGAVLVNGVAPGSAADKDGRLRAGDLLLQIDEWDVRAASHQLAVSKLNEAKRQLYLLVRRQRNAPFENKLHDVFAVDLVKRPGHGLGICIAGRAGGGVYVTRLIPDSVAREDGRLEPGDVLLEMNGTDVREMTHLEVASLLKMSMGLVVLVVARSRWHRLRSIPTTSDTPRSPAASMPRSVTLQGSPGSMDSGISQSHSVVSFITDHMDRVRRRRIAYRRYRSRSRSASPGGTFSSTSSTSSDRMRSASPTQALQTIVNWFTREYDYVLENPYEVFDVALKRNAAGELGMQIFSSQHLDLSLGMHLRDASFPFVVTNMAVNEPARQSNQIKVGDRIISVNDQLVACMTRDEVIGLLHGAPNSQLHVRFERPADNPVVAKVPRLAIAAPSELSVKKAVMNRGSAGLGLSLIGGQDEKSGKFVPFQVKSLFDGSVALKAGVKPGDCVLAVNDISFDGLTHEMAVYLLKRAQGQTSLTLLTS